MFNVFFFKFSFLLLKMAEQVTKVIGYDFNTKHPVPKAYQCLICHLLIRGFTELKCGHSFCKLCLERWEELKREENKKLKRFEFLVLKMIVKSQNWPN